MFKQKGDLGFREWEEVWSDGEREEGEQANKIRKEIYRSSIALSRRMEATASKTNLIWLVSVAQVTCG